MNTNAHYWTALAGIAWDRDVDIDFDREPVDLDGDGQPDTHVTRHIHAKGGVLANPDLFGLTPTPDDPRGRVGHISASTGVLGLREALRPDGAPSGEIGMTCWLCHGGAHDGPSCWDCRAPASTMASCSRPPPSSTTRTPTRPRTGARAAFRPVAPCARGCCSPARAGRI